ncbi:MAG: DUF1330 domain-containing protein [Gammaproteobacteria bacterium]|nr:DUF1330 domain-containing protein [Gammaproteobacteria bacterium]
MTAYCVFDIRSESDPEAMAEYRRRVRPTITAYGGQLLALGDHFEVVEGDWRPVYPVILAFPSYEKAKEWYDSDSYAELKIMRFRASVSDAVFIDGLPASSS